MAGKGRWMLNWPAIPPGSACTVYSEGTYSYWEYSARSSLLSSAFKSSPVCVCVRACVNINRCVGVNIGFGLFCFVVCRGANAFVWK